MITFRKAKEGDIEIIQDIAYRTWPTTYNAVIGEAQVKYMLDKMYNRGELLGQLMAGHVFLIAEQNDTAVGFAGFSRENTSNAVYKLHKLYVLPETHGKGIGKVLMNEVINHIKREGGKALQLNVNKQNKAKSFYEHAGFIIKEPVNIDIGNGFFMDDYVMELSL